MASHVRPVGDFGDFRSAPDALGAPGDHAGDLCFLVIEDDTLDVLAIRDLLDRSPFRHARLERTSDATGVRTAIRTHGIDLVLADFWLGTRSSISLINEISALRPRLPVIMLGAFPATSVARDDSGASLFYLARARLTSGMLEIAVRRALACTSRQADMARTVNV